MYIVALFSIAKRWKSYTTISGQMDKQNVIYIIIYSIYIYSIYNVIYIYTQPHIDIYTYTYTHWNSIQV